MLGLIYLFGWMMSSMCRFWIISDGALMRGMYKRNKICYNLIGLMKGFVLGGSSLTSVFQYK